MILIFYELATTSPESYDMERLLGQFLIPYTWWEDSSNSYAYQFDVATLRYPGRLRSVTIVNGTANLPLSALSRLRSYFNLPRSEQPSTVMEFIGAVGDNWYGRESLKTRCRFISVKEYASECGPARFNLEMGRSINGEP